MEGETEEKQDVPKEVKKKQTQIDPSIQCLFSRKVCKRKRLRGFDFCHKHIFEDKNSPFQQCSFIIKSTEERCVNPAPKAENKKTFCLIHTRDPKLKKAHDEIMRRNMKRKLAQRKATAGAKKSSSDSFASGSSQRSPHEPKRARDGDYDQFTALEKPESDGIYALQDNGGRRYDVSWFGENDSDAESVDSEEEDPLRHAGVWTLEEALKICRDKMIRKRVLYLEQYKRLHLLLKERRRRHLQRMAQNMYCPETTENNAGNQKDASLKSLEQKALGLYQHLNGTELLLEKQAKEKRAHASGNPKPVSQARCSFLDSMDQCKNGVLPYSKFCLHHICNDPDQRLYKKCTFESDNSNIFCSTPVLQVFRSTLCDLHSVPLPRYQSAALQSVMNPVGNSESGSTTTAIPEDASAPGKTKSSDEGEKIRSFEGTADNTHSERKTEEKKGKEDSSNDAACIEPEKLTEDSLEPASGEAKEVDPGINSENPNDASKSCLDIQPKPMTETSNESAIKRKESNSSGESMTSTVTKDTAGDVHEVTKDDETSVLNDDTLTSSKMDTD